MPISKTLQTPGGATIGFHVAQRIEAQTLDAAQVLMVMVASWPSAEAYDLADGKAPTWNDWHPVPFASIAQGAAAGLAHAAEQALVSSTQTPFAAGVLEPARDGLAGVKARRWSNIKMQRDLLDNAPITHGDFELDADASSRMDLMGAVMSMQITGQASRLWRCTDNVMRELTLSDLLAVGTSIAARRQALIETSDALYQLIQAAETVEQVEAICWPSEETPPPP